MVDFKKLSAQAKDLVEKRGGTEALKQDAEQLKEIVKGKGTLADKAKAAAAALKQSGGETADAEVAEKPPAAAATGTEQHRAEDKVRDEGRGKHAEVGEGGKGHGRKGGRGQGQRRGGGDPAV